MAIAYSDIQSGTDTSFWIRFVLSVLATWRISHLLVSEDGPWEILARLRKWLGASAMGRLMDCFGCVSIWVAAPMSFFIFQRLPELFGGWLALSGAAFLSLSQPVLRPAGGAVQPLMLRYIGQSGIVVRGPATGRAYAFSAGAPVHAVDLRDAAVLLRTNYFRQA